MVGSPGRSNTKEHVMSVHGSRTIIIDENENKSRREVRTRLRYPHCMGHWHVYLQAAFALRGLLS